MNDDVSALPDEQLLGFVHAQYRQLAFQQERLWAALAEVARRPPLRITADASLSPERQFDLAAAEISAELRVSRFAAERELGYGLDLVSLPRVAAALRAGELDRSKAVVLVEACRDLTEAHRDTILDEILPTAAMRRVSELKARVQRLAIALDPSWAERRYRQAVSGQKVVHYLAEDGTVTVTASGLPAEQALAAMARLSRLAHAAKRAGARASVDRLRGTLICGLIDARFAGMTEPQIIAELVTEFPQPTADPTTDPTAAPTGHPTAPTGQPTAPSGQPAEPPAGPPAQPSADEPVRVVDSGVELRVGLATLMGLVEEPGEVAGAGPVIAAVARELAERQRRGQWRFAILDADGHLLFDGLTRYRPTTVPAGGDSGGIVELHVPTHLLDPSLAEEHPAWARLLTDLARQYDVQAPIVQDPAARLPGRPLRRHVQVKHRSCSFPGCRRPAAQSQVDHRRDHAKHGPTHEDNLGPACAHHHDLKTRWGWRLVKRDERTYLWISPLNRRHVVTIEPIAPPFPAPIPQSETAPDPPPDRPDDTDR